MSLASVRGIALPGVRAFQASLISVAMMAAVILGLLAMHATGTDHVQAPATALAGISESHSAVDLGPGELPGPLAAAAVTGASASVAAVVECGESCLESTLSCMFMIMTCVVLVIVALTALLANRPAVYKWLRNVRARAVVMDQDVSLRFLFPDLNVLSISRT